MADDGFREIHLNGKQLIFLFMATTIVAVVVFLCGVTVGRGVRNATAPSTGNDAATAAPVDLTAAPVTPKPSTTRAPALADVPPPTPAAEEAPAEKAGRAAPPATAPGSGPGAKQAPVSPAAAARTGLPATGNVGAPVTPPPAAAARTNVPSTAAAAPAAKPGAPPVTAPAGRPAGAPVTSAGGRPGAAPLPPTVATTAKATPVPATGKASPTPAAPTQATMPAARESTVPGPPPGNGYSVQVAAVTSRAEAEMIARRLMSKGYRTFVMEPAAADGMFRVRVGKYADRREADATLRRLEKEEQLKGLWIPPTR